MRIIIFLALLFVIHAQYCGDWIPIDWTTLQKPLSSDTIRVRYVVAPLLYCSYLDELTYVNGYHGGLAFVNVRTGYSLTMNFDAFPTFQGAFVPAVTKFANGSYNLQWENFGKIFIYNGINTTYWYSLDQHVADLTGDQFMKYVAWAVALNETNLHYDPWSVYYLFPNGVYIKAYECFQWVGDSLYQMQVFGGKLAPGVTKIYSSIVALYADDTPKEVNLNDPKWTKPIVDFYEFVDGQWNTLGADGFFLELFRVALQNQFFVYKDVSYYYVQLTFPYFEWHWVETPIPIYNNTILTS